MTKGRPGHQSAGRFQLSAGSGLTARIVKTLPIDAAHLKEP